jgi:chromate transporter
MSGASDDQGIALTILLHFSAISMMAVGGGVIVLTPELERLVVDQHHWMLASEFLADYTLAQAAPGPNMLFVTLIGLRAAGWMGALAATLAIIVPPSAFLLGVLELGRRHPGQLGVGWLRRILAPLSVGMMVASAWTLTRMAVQTPLALVLTVLTVAVLLGSRLNPLYLIALGAACGALGLV